MLIKPLCFRIPGIHQRFLPELHGLLPRFGKSSTWCFLPAYSDALGLAFLVFPTLCIHWHGLMFACCISRLCWFSVLSDLVLAVWAVIHALLSLSFSGSLSALFSSCRSFKRIAQHLSLLNARLSSASYRSSTRSSTSLVRLRTSMSMTPPLGWTSVLWILVERKTPPAFPKWSTSTHKYVYACHSVWNCNSTFTAMATDSHPHMS